MAADTPLTTLSLAASSVADELGFVALSDISRALTGSDYRVIGGHMVTILAARWRLDTDLYRETGDADLGVPPVLVREHGIPDRLKALGYEQIAGNRFVREVPGVPVTVAGAQDAPHRAVIDVLIPAYTSRARHNIEVGEQLVTTEVPGLAAALNQSPVTMTLELRRLNGDTLHARALIPDEGSALVLKSLATRVRDKGTDVTDIWRCLEIAYAAGVSPSDFTRGIRREAAEIVRALFDRRNGPGMAALAAELRLPAPVADRQFTRIRALIAQVAGPG